MKSSNEKGRNFRRVRCRLRRVGKVVCELFRGGRAADWPAINEVALVVCQCGGLAVGGPNPRYTNLFCKTLVTVATDHSISQGKGCTYSIC